MSLPLALRTAVSRKTLVPLVGAGVSMSVKKVDGGRVFPSWPELLALGVQALLSENKEAYARAAKSMLDLNKFQESADLLKEGLTGSLWQKFLRGVFDVEKASIDANTLSLPKAIWTLSDRVITLNFEKVLEISSPAPNDTGSLTNLYASELATFANGDVEKNTVWHLHGSIENISSIIFTGSSYETLYKQDDNYIAALEVLNSIARSSNLLFVGCSLEDADLLSKINKIHAVFGDNTGPHYALVHKAEVAEIRGKLKGLPIDIIEFEEFGKPLVDLINEISSTAGGCVSTSTSSIKTNENMVPVVLRKKAAILYADPVDRNIVVAECMSTLKKLDIEKHYLHLNIGNLNSLENFDYIFIFTSVLRGKILIEDDYGAADRISVTNLFDNIAAPSCCGIFIFVDQKSIEKNIRDELKTVLYPAAIIPYVDKNTISSIFFKLFKKKTPLAGDDVCLSSSSIILAALTGENIDIFKKTLLPESIDPRTLKGFTGRSTDLKNIIRASLELSGKDNILTIKGAGGVGKTAVTSMAALELAKRNHFQNGIGFIDCEFVASCEILETSIARFFDLDTTAKFKDDIRTLIVGKDRLLILDNVETLIYLSDWNKIKDLLSFICEYSFIIVTSREPLAMENEVVYELRRLTTDEATDLFINQLAREISLDDRKIIRDKIVEEILDNNPLAIKLITRNIPNGKSLEKLAVELEHSLFNDIHDDEINVFNSSSDQNVERKRTLYASINYSYKKLNDKEKNVFQLLSLFPDGVNMETFKTIAKGVKQNKRREEQRAANPLRQFIITDTILKSLEDKSLIQSSNGHVRLQSLVGKFSDQKLQVRESDELSRVYGNFFSHLKDFANKLTTLDLDDSLLSTRIFNSYQKNFIKCVSVADKIPASPEEVCEYLIDILGLCVSNCTTSVFIRAMDEAKLDYSSFEIAEISKAVTYASALYYNGNFKGGLSMLKDILPPEKMFEVEGKSFIDRDIAISAASIYGMEGDSLGALVIYERHKRTFYHCPDVLLQIGTFCRDIMISSIPSFFTFESKWLMNELSVEEIDSYITGLHEKNHLEIIQSNYVRAKLTGKSKTKMTKLVPVSPYAEGIKLIIMALCEKNSMKKIIIFKSALPNLFHIKYYYVEGILLLTQFLKEISSPEFDEYFSLGIELAEKYHYRHLIYRFEQVKNRNNIMYDEDHYPLPNDRDYKIIISNLINKINLARARA